MATLKQINERIQRVEPCVELVRGEGYHYYSFDNGLFPTDAAERKANQYRPTSLKPGAGDTWVSDDRSEMIPYLGDMPASWWIATGIEYGREMRRRHYLPAQGDA